MPQPLQGVAVLRSVPKLREPLVVLGLAERLIEVPALGDQEEVFGVLCQPDARAELAHPLGTIVVIVAVGDRLALAQGEVDFGIGDPGEPKKAARLRRHGTEYARPARTRVDAGHLSAGDGVDAGPSPDCGCVEPRSQLVVGPEDRGQQVTGEVRERFLIIGVRARSPLHEPPKRHRRRLAETTAIRYTRIDVTQPVDSGRPVRRNRQRRRTGAARRRGPRARRGTHGLSSRSIGVSNALNDSPLRVGPESHPLHLCRRA